MTKIIKTKKTNIKPIIKPIKVISIIVLCGLLIIGVPIAINELYKRGPGYVTMWGAKEVLNYYGTILASVGAILGVFFSIRAAHKNYQEDVRARVLPFIAVTPLERKASVDFMALLKEHTQGKTETSDPTTQAVVYEEYRLEKIYFVISVDGIEVKNKLNKFQQEILSQIGNVCVTTAKGSSALQRISYFSLPLEIENVGNGTVVALKIGFNKTTTNRSQYKYVRPMMLKQEQTLYIHIFSTEEFDAVGGEYILEFFYKDIHRNKYVQQFPVRFGKDDAGREYQSIDYVGEQTHYTGDDLNADA